MRRTTLVVLSSFLIFLTLGCSKQLTRRQATYQINEMLKPRPIGPHKVIVADQVPGFRVEGLDSFSSAFALGLTGTSNGLPIEQALTKAGYINVEPGGPGVIDGNIHVDSTRTVTFTPKAGSAKSNGYDNVYQAGFSCYPLPNPNQCTLPPLLERDKDTPFQITGITQDETHAKVNILIPWKLTPIALELKPYARKKADYFDHWEEFLNSHTPTGSEPAVILFQKFDDGWRITDETGHTEKDFGK